MVDLSELTHLCQQAAKAVDSGESTKDFEPSFVVVLRFLEANEDQREVRELMARAVTDASVPWELIEFAMATLKWQEVKDAARNRLRRADDPRVHAVMRHILSAYEAEWSSADLYDYYSAVNRAARAR